MENIINNYYEVEKRESLAIIFIKKDIFELIIGEDYKLLFETLDSLQYDPKIKVLLFLNSSECYGEKVYFDFLSKLNLSLDKIDNYEFPNFCDAPNRFRELNILNRFVSYLSNYNKLCFSVLSGGIVTPFFGASLATDIRYATQDMYFSLAHNKYGLHPSGGLPYFLINQLGYSKAMELMLSEKITAEEALGLGLISTIISSENTESLVINDIEKILKFSSCTLRRTKQLSSYAHNSLSDYFEYEQSILNL